MKLFTVIKERLRINIYIENTYSDTEPKVYTEKGKLEAIQQMAQKIREDANWVNDTLYSRYHHNELYEKMLTEKGREEVEYFLQCAARDYAGESFEGDYFATTLDV